MIEVKSKDCPERDSLRSLLLGKMTDADAEALEGHLLECDQCAAAAETIAPHDDLTDAFRNHKLLEDEEDIVNEVIARARQLRSKDDTGCVEETVVSSSAARATAGSSSSVSSSVVHEPSPAGQASSGTPTMPEVDEAILDCLAPSQAPGEIGRLANYRVLEVLGSGGMGVVFLAEDLQLKRQVALKVMKPVAAANREAKDRFLREAQATAAIEHDHIVSIYQVGEDRGVPFIAMRYLRGESLQSRLKREGRLDQREALRIGRELADGLAAAHQRGLIHRDIKPANVWLEEKDEGERMKDERKTSDSSFRLPPSSFRVKIVDFGLVRAVADDAELTRSGVIVGTPCYMSPEQAQGRKVDERCDLFSLGSLLYRLVSGKAAFAGKNTTAALIAVAQRDPEPLANVAPGLDADFAALITGLLEKNPDDRPSSADEVSQRIADIEQRVERPESAKGVELDHALPFGQGVPPGRLGDTLLAPTETYRPTEPDSVSAVRVHRTRLYQAAAVALLLLPLCYFFGGTVIRFVTNQGLLVVEVDDRNVEITIRQNSLVVHDKSTHREFQLQAVAGEIEVYDKGGNATLLTKKFTLSRGGKAYVTVTLQELAKARPAADATRLRAEPRKGPGPWQPTPAHQKFLDAVAKLKPQQQLEAVREQLKLVNPGFDGKLQHTIEGSRVVELRFITIRSSTFHRSGRCRVSKGSTATARLSARVVWRTSPPCRGCC